ncbi:DUF6221 family protein [Amycolatopsis minnesotensis]|uniref:DUF6221 family protein n=1 Tax=Amycolatopsis minnesotensis TaxID=337894 RepID=A0ABP5E0K9_9PSEU
MDDLVAFLNTRITERQTLLMRAVTKRKSGEAIVREEGSVLVEARIRSLNGVELDAVHRMVDELESARRICHEHRTTVHERVPGFPVHGGDYWCQTCHVPSDDPGANWCLTLRLLAAPYADHPQYVSSWRP